MNKINNKNKFLQYLSDQGLEVFTLDQVVRYFNGLSKADYEFVEDLARKGTLTRLMRGLYTVNPRVDRNLKHMPSWHKVAAAMAYPRDYYIGFYSALQLHELITQPALREYLVMTEQVSPKVRKILDVPFEMICLKQDRFFGYKKTWINDHDKGYCSDLEKTIIDCLSKPKYAGGIEGIVKAIDKARHKIKANVLIEYAIKFDAQSVMKRLGYVLDGMELFATVQNILQELISESYTKLDPSLKIKGKFHRKWRIEDNLDIKELLQTMKNHIPPEKLCDSRAPARAISKGI